MVNIGRLYYKQEAPTMAVAACVLVLAVLASVAESSGAIDWGSQCHRHMGKNEFALHKGEEPLVVWTVVRGALDAQMLLTMSSADVKLHIHDSSTGQQVLTWPDQRLAHNLRACHSYKDLQICYVYSIGDDGTVKGSISMDGELDTANLVVTALTDTDVAHLQTNTFWRPSRSPCCFGLSECHTEVAVKIEPNQANLIASFETNKERASLQMGDMKQGDTIMLLNSATAAIPLTQWVQDNTTATSCIGYDQVSFCYDPTQGLLNSTGFLSRSVEVAVVPLQSRSMQLEAGWLQPALECLDKNVAGVYGQACFPVGHNCTDISGAPVACHTEALDTSCSPDDAKHTVWPTCAGGTFYCQCSELEGGDKSPVCVGSRQFESKCEARCVLGDHNLADMKDGKCETQSAIGNEQMCKCPKVHEPVCVDGVTFANLCEAQCALPSRLTSHATLGACGTTQSNITDLFYEKPKSRHFGAIITQDGSRGEIPEALAPKQEVACHCTLDGRAVQNAVGAGVPVCIKGDTYRDMCSAVCQIGLSRALTATVGVCGTRTGRGALCGTIPHKSPSPPACLDGLVCAPLSQGATLGKCLPDLCQGIQCPSNALCQVNSFGCDNEACPVCIELPFR